jgi:hypothetical protein
MAFLDNSGDIILDAVLTDTGRKRLARGDGTFRIVKFALGDDEINYGNFDGDASTGLQDLEIMRTPILEAFTNNTSQMHSFLQTYTNNQTHLYLPVIKINTNSNPMNPDFNTFLVTVDDNTTDALLCSYDDTSPYGDSALKNRSGILKGQNPDNSSFIRLDQGIDNLLSPVASGLPTSEFYENQYMIEMDSRFGEIVSSDGTARANPSFIDDDQIASYYLSKTVNGDFVLDNTSQDSIGSGQQIIAGARGTYLQFQIQVTQNLQANESWFTRMGGQFNAGSVPNPRNCYFIDTVIRITGLTTGYRVDIPVRYVRAIDAYYCGPPV